MEALASLGYDTSGKIPAALLNWILHFNPNNNDHVHQMMLTNPHTIASGADGLHFHCYICCNKYVLKVLKPIQKIVRNDFTCPKGPTHHLHTCITSDKYIELSKTEIEIRCCLCDYHAILSYESPPVSEDIMDAFIMSLESRKSAINILKSLRNLLDEALRGRSREVSYNTEIINILQNEHGV
jgi:hypothetical protein